MRTTFPIPRHPRRGLERREPELLFLAVFGGAAEMLREPVGGGVVEEVGFVAVGGVVGGGEVEGGFAG